MNITCFINLRLFLDYTYEIVSQLWIAENILKIISKIPFLYLIPITRNNSNKCLDS